MFFKKKEQVKIQDLENVLANTMTYDILDLLIHGEQSSQSLCSNIGVYYKRFNFLISRMADAKIVKLARSTMRTRYFVLDRDGIAALISKISEPKLKLYGYIDKLKKYLQAD